MENPLRSQRQMMVSRQTNCEPSTTCDIGSDSVEFRGITCKRSRSVAAVRRTCSSERTTIGINSSCSRYSPTMKCRISCRKV